jgi:hypothetical protein
MVYSPHAPYEVLATKTMDFETIQRMRRFARYWDLVANSGNFVRATPLIWKDQSPFTAFMRWSEWLYEKIGRTHAISLNHLAEALFEYLSTRGVEKQLAAATMAKDLSGHGRGEAPEFLRPYVTSDTSTRKQNTAGLRRQARHLA